MKRLILLTIILIPFICFAQKQRIYQLTTEGTITNSHYLVVDKASFSQSKKVTVQELTSIEREAREDEDDSTRTGAGLTDGGLYETDETSTYLTQADFTSVSLTPNLYNADQILDSVVSRMDSIQSCFTFWVLNDQLTLSFTDNVWTKITDGNNDWSELLSNCYVKAGDSLQITGNGVYYIQLTVTDSMELGNDEYGALDLTITVNGTPLAYPATTSQFKVDLTDDFWGDNSFETTTFIGTEVLSEDDWIAIYGRRRNSTNDITFRTGHFYIRRIQ